MFDAERRQSPTKTYPWQRKRRRVMLYVVLPPIVIIAAVLSVRLHLKRQVDIRLNAIRTAGYPASLEELDAFYTAVPDADNAALTYLEAIERYQRIDEKTYEELRPYLEVDYETAPNEPWPTDIQALFAKHLERNAESLALVHQASALTQSHYPIDFALGNEIKLSHLASLRTLARLLGYQARCAAEQGDNALIVQSCLDGLAMARSLESEPVLISQLVRQACEGIVVSTLSCMLSRHQLDAQSAAVLQAAFAAQNPVLCARTDSMPSVLCALYSESEHGSNRPRH